MADVSSIKLPNGTEYKVKDSTARNHIDNKNNPHGVTAEQAGALPLNGGTMTGQILTSFKNSVAVGSYQPDASIIPDLVEELRYSSGCMGSVNIKSPYKAMPAGWYNFIYIPHRSGGYNGLAHDDNCDYGNLIMIGMTIDFQAWIINFQNNVIKNYFSIRNTDTTYSVATQNANGLMSSSDKTKLDSLSATSVSAITNSEIDTIVAS
nr:MAG: hypothetical protein [Bacteriophage sp.]